MTSNIPSELLNKIKELEIGLPCYIRKINKLTKWNGLGGNIDQRAKQAVERNFYENENIYSLWHLEEIEQFLGIIAIMRGRQRPDTFDFICIKENDLIQAGIIFKPVTEGQCIYVRDLHFNATIDKIKAEKLCKILIERKVEARRCKKELTKQILDYQEKLGCYSTKSIIQNCTKNTCT